MMKIKQRKRLSLILVLVFLMTIFGGTAMAADDYTEADIAALAGGTLTLATTTSTYDSGLLDFVLPVFEAKYGVKVEVISVGSGAAIQMGKDGDADVLLVHSRAAEDAFVAEGYGIHRVDVMYNQFLVVGPAADPAGIAGTSDVVAGFAAIAKNGTFVSRGDKSGTHTRELGIWPKAEVEPAGQAWYVEAGQGMGATLTMAAEMDAYTLIDEATWLSWKDKDGIKGVITEAVAGDPLLLNPYGIIEVNPEKHPSVNNLLAHMFKLFMTSEEGQALIGEFGVDKYGKGLFVPDAATVEAVTEVIAPVVVVAPVVEIVPYTGSAIPTGEGSDISIILDGAKLKMDSYPYIVNGSTMVPVAVISEDLGYVVVWNDIKQEVTISDPVTASEIVLAIGSTTVYKNGVAETLEVPAELSNNRTMVPVRFVAEAFGCKVDWNGETNTVIIQSDAEHTSGI